MEAAIEYENCSHNGHKEVVSFQTSLLRAMGRTKREEPLLKTALKNCPFCGSVVVLCKNKNGDYASYFCSSPMCKEKGYIKNSKKKETKMTKNNVNGITASSCEESTKEITNATTKENFVELLNNVLTLDKKSRELIEFGFDMGSHVVRNIELSSDIICETICNLYGIDIEFFVEWFYSDKKKVSKRSGKTRYILIDTPERFYAFAMANGPTLMEYEIVK
jgi:hypothetical protein